MKLERLERTLSKAAENRTRVAGEKETRLARLTELRSELEGAQRRLLAKALVPGAQDTGAVEEMETRIEDVRAQVEALESAEQEAGQTYLAAKQAVEDACFTLTPDAASKVKAADAEYVEALGALGQRAVKGLAEVLAAEGRQEKSLRDLQSLTGRLKGAGPARREQVLELRAFLRNRDPVSDEVILGYWLLKAAEVLRRSGGPAELWKKAGIPLLEGSALEGGIGVDRYQLLHQRQLLRIDL